MTKVSDGCCEEWKCDCVCELYGDPHYTSFGGIDFDFLENCTYVLVEELNPVYNLTIAVDNFYCRPRGSCVKGIILKYKMNTATLYIFETANGEKTVEVSFNSVTIQPPFEKDGLRFESTEKKVFIHLPEIRSFISLTPYNTLAVSLAMEFFLNKIQGQCGECGAARSCVRKGGPTTSPSPRTAPICSNKLCDLLNHQVFSECRKNVSLSVIKKNCEFDGCGNKNASCSALEKAAEDCKKKGFCIDWRNFTDGICETTCEEGLVYEECRNTNDDYCFSGEHCQFCIGSRGELRLPGEKWANESCCYICVERTCTYQGKTYKVGDQWKDSNYPCMSLSCTLEGVKTNKTVCPVQNCLDEDKVWDDQKCCFTCTSRKSQCSPKMTNITTTVDSCTAVIEVPVCKGQCYSQPSTNSTMKSGILEVHQVCKCCETLDSEKRTMELSCQDNSKKTINYEYVKTCDCKICKK
ncbi:hypothetical protein OJAV_G00205940 [Oryzias javanicus]|uniref:CTCK domain-containing protein n=1 Tax=Oryzias javanicus TaxID=123683 RepID=A0A3S2NWA7_ORYJA|nr:hypothetical protein OJAV_G00205940 [Oryzias javanicus]